LKKLALGLGNGPNINWIWIFR